MASETVAQAAPVDNVAPAVVPQETDGPKLYVGNLSGKVTEENLRELFQPYGQITSLMIHHARVFRKYKNFAFVTFETQEQANSALEATKGQSLLERPLQVSLARPRRDYSAEQPKTSSPDLSNGTSTTAGAPSVEPEGRARKPRQQQSKPAQPPRRKGPPENGVESPDSIFVAGINTKATDEEFKNLFAEFNVVSAKVSLRVIPHFMARKLEERGETRFNRGFGFVTLASKEEQERAVEEMNGKTIDGRKLVVKKAMDKPEKAKVPGDDAAEPPAAADAPSATAPKSEAEPEPETNGS